MTATIDAQFLNASHAGPTRIADSRARLNTTGEREIGLISFRRPPEGTTNGEYRGDKHRRSDHNKQADEYQLAFRFHYAPLFCASMRGERR